MTVDMSAPLQSPVREEHQPRVTIRRLEANHQGRDFIVGDLHGCRSVLDRALHELRFNPAHDRLLSVGDLIDRGPDSPGCLTLLSEPWFHAVQGNHEAMLGARLAGDRDSEQMHLHNGGDWFRGARQVVKDPALAAMIDRAVRLPHVLVVGSGTERYQILHAELPPGRETAVQLDADIDAGLVEVDPSALLWSRNLMLPGTRPNIPSEQPGLSTTYCGHTPGGNVRRRLSHVCLDTGAVFARPRRSGDRALSIAERRGDREHCIHRFAV